MIRSALAAAFCCLMLTALAGAAPPDRRTIIYEGKVSEVRVLPNVTETWITMNDLKRSTGFVVKPQGICRDELCFPIPRNQRAQFTSRKGSTTWFNLSQFAKLVKQPVAIDETNGALCFGARADQQGAVLTDLTAPEFTLPDMQGKAHSLSQYRGKKVLLVTWASW
jgi:hypothetical protein